MRAFRCLQPGGDCDSPGRSSGDAGAAVPQVSAAERRGGVVGGAHRVGVLGSLAGATCGPRSNFCSLIEKPPGTREGARREFGGGHLGSCRPARPWVPRPALSKAACWLRSLMTRGKVVTSSSYGGGWNSTSRGAWLLSGGSGAVRRLGQEEAGVILRIQGCLSFGLGEGCMRQFLLTRLILAGCSGFPRLFRLYFFSPTVRSSEHLWWSLSFFEYPCLC